MVHKDTQITPLSFSLLALQLQNASSSQAGIPSSLGAHLFLQLESLCSLVGI